MPVDPASVSYTQGQASIVEYFASCVVAIPLERIVDGLDRIEADYPRLEGDDTYSIGTRQRIRDTAAILLDAKRAILALYACHAALITANRTVRDSRPPLAVPIDPTLGRRSPSEGH